MTKSTNIRSRNQHTGLGSLVYIIVVCVIILLLTNYLGYMSATSEKKLFSVGLLALFAGLLFESLRMADNWKSVFYIFIGSYLFSLFIFIPYKREYTYIIEDHIKDWPYMFIFLYSLAFASFYSGRVTVKLDEGVTLLLSLSLVYWVIDYGFLNYHHWFAYTLLTIAFLMTSYSITNALIDLKLSKATRLTLSIWSTFILLAFAIDNIYQVYSNPDIESTHFANGLYIGIQFFLLGVSSLYIMQEIKLLIAFLPSKNGNYRSDIKENKNDHMKRFSEKQMLTSHSMLSIFYAAIIYGYNYKYQILPRHTMIWMVFLTYPLLLIIFDLITKRKKQYR